MKTMVSCKKTKKGCQTYYLGIGTQEIMLFTSALRKSNADYFGNGCSVDDLFKAKRHHSSATRKIAERLISAIKYAEKEYGICVLEQTAKRQQDYTNAKKQQNKTWRMPLNLDKYDEKDIV